MTGWTVAEVAAIAGGAAVGATDELVTSVVIDSRQVRPGALFVALQGEHDDGHRHVAAALGAGAAAVLVQPERVDVAPRIEVVDGEAALLALAVERRNTIEVPVVAVTGSTGKTTTKDLIAAALGPGTWASPASFNNELGVPLTVLNVPRDASAVVVEMGSRGLGHLTHLMPAVRPDVAVITNLGLVHLETFGSEENLARAKWEIVEGLPDAGTAVLPAGESRFPGRHPNTVTFGTDIAATVTVESVELDADGRPLVELGLAGDRRAVRLGLAGAHNAENAAAAVAAATAAGVSFGDAVDRLADATPARWRMEVVRGAFTVVNDAYNANPTSMEAALRVAADLGKPRLAVLGRMAELGDVTEREHIRIARLAEELGFDPLIVVGDDPGYGRGSEAVVTVDTVDDAVRLAADLVVPGAVVLVKGSRVAGLESVAMALAERAGEEGT